MKYGAFFTEHDVQSAAKVCTLGINVADNLFGEDVDPTGTEIRIRNQIFKVLGVMSAEGRVVERPESGRPDPRALHDGA